jgi:hypothetical protein
MIIGDLKIEVLNKEFYCRHCKVFTPSCKNKHRMGLWFLVKITNTKNNKSVYSILGYGEKECDFAFDVSPGESLYSGMSGCERYDIGYVTCGGWCELFTPIFAATMDLDVNKNVNLSEFENVELANLLDENKVDILTELMSREIINLYTDMGLWNSIKPLLKIYQSGKVRSEGKGVLEWIENSFTAEFRYHNICIQLPKSTVKEIGFNPYLFNAHQIITKKYMILFKEIFTRKIVILRKYNSNVFEIYQEADGEVIKSEIKSNYFDYRADLIFDYVIGNYIIIPDEKYRIDINTDEFNKDKFFIDNILFGGKVSEYGEVEGKRITIVNKKYGVLELPEGKYLIRKI